jgi:hypothetical protein
MILLGDRVKPLSPVGALVTDDKATSPTCKSIPSKDSTKDSLTDSTQEDLDATKVQNASSLLFSESFVFRVCTQVPVCEGGEVLDVVTKAQSEPDSQNQKLKQISIVPLSPLVQSWLK